MFFLYLAPVLGLLVLEVFFVYKAAANRNRAKLIAGTPIAKIAELGDGPAKVEGRIVALGDFIPAPLSGRPCVYYRFQVKEMKTRHGPPPHGGGYWKTVINDVQCILCGVDDGTGVAGLDLRGAEMLLSPSTQMRSGFFNDAPALMQADVGIAFGSGADIAIESAGVIILNKRVGAVLDAYEVSRSSYRKIVQNVSLAFLFNGLGIPVKNGTVPLAGFILLDNLGPARRTVPFFNGLLGHK